MARQKKYIESEVIEKAMQLFWRNGYETTSVRMLEKEMGINQFSMYASFGNKQGVFIESVKCYQKKARIELIDKLKSAPAEVSSIKQYFIDFVNFSKEEEESYKGCLLTNTVNELGASADPEILSEIIQFAYQVKTAFIEILEKDTTKNKETIAQQANYLMVALQGLSVSSKMFKKQQLDDFITGTFINI